MKTLKLLLKLVKWCLACIGAYILVSFALGVSGIIPEDKDSLIVSRWGISEEKDNSLLINLLDQDDVPVIVNIDCDPEKGLLESISVVKVFEEERGFVFSYKPKGEYGIPAALYGYPRGRTGLVWHDLDFDGRFDLVADLSKQRTKINVQGRWLRGSGGKREVVTDEGVFIFDPQSGKWQTIDPNKFILPQSAK